MILKGVTADYLFIDKPDENGVYRLRIQVSKEQKDELFAVMQEIAKEHNKSLDKCNWKGSYKEGENGEHFFNLKCKQTITNKKGETVDIKLRVYDARAKLIENVDKIANGALVNVEIKPYWAQHLSKFGVMLGLRSVQLLKYELWEGSNPYIVESDYANDIPDVTVDEEDNPFD